MGYVAPAPPDVEPRDQAEPTPDELDAVQLAVVTRMLAVWARTVQGDAHSYYQAAVKADWTDRAIEYGEDWSPATSDLVSAMEQVWVRGYKLVMSTCQMTRWESARGRLAGEPEVTEDSRLRALRNAIGHLDESHFTELVARRSPTERRRHVSIDDLPGKELFLGFASGYTEAAFGVVELKEVTTRARRYAYIDDEYADWEPSDIDFENMGYTDRG